MDNVISAHEILHYVHRSKEPGLLLKLDFEKSFDNVDWNCIMHIFFYNEGLIPSELN
jgi:hypothetical protein